MHGETRQTQQNPLFASVVNRRLVIAGWAHHRSEQWPTIRLRLESAEPNEGRDGGALLERRQEPSAPLHRGPGFRAAVQRRHQGRHEQRPDARQLQLEEP